MASLYHLFQVKLLSIVLVLLLNPLKPEGDTAPLTLTNLAGELIRNDIDHWQVVMAQAIVESGWNFDSPLFVRTNNFGGMRIPRNRQSMRVGEFKGYSTYKCWQDCVKDIKYWQEQNWEGGTQDEYIQMVDTYWAESPVYARELRKVINRINRMKYDLVKANEGHFNYRLIEAYLARH